MCAKVNIKYTKKDKSETVIKSKQVNNDKNTNDVSTSINNLINNVEKADKDEYKHF